MDSTDTFRVGRPISSQPSIQTKHLNLSSAQAEAIAELYSSGKIEVRLYDEDDLSVQSSVKEYCENQGFGCSMERKLESHWSTVWSTSWNSGGDKKKRTLFQWYLALQINLCIVQYRGCTFNIFMSCSQLVWHRSESEVD